MSVSARRVKSWIGSLAVLAALATLIGLGTWQVERRAWKHALIAHIEARIHAPAVVLPGRIDDPRPWDYRHVRATGHFLHDHELHLANRVRDGEAGVDVVTPLVRPDGDVVLVDRGWVPLDLADPARRGQGQVPGTVTVAGIARIPAGPGYFTPPNDPARGFWITADIKAMARAMGLGPALPVVLEADATPNPGGWPRGGGTRVTLRDEHLQYAITWYSLAVALVVIVLVSRRRRATRPGPRA